MLDLPERTAGGWPVTIADPAGCGRFVTVRVEGIDPTAPSPYWMRRRLSAAGIRSISLAVDVTNYVMLELGQPLHAFDADKLTGSITVRRAVDGETLVTLDGSKRTLVADDLVVADESGAISMAGVMGGESTEISSGTTNVIIEAAHWDPPVIMRTVRRHRLPSEAARRFERAVDPAVAAVATEAAADLLVRYGGGTVVGRSDGWGDPLPRPDIELAVTEPERLIGRPYDRAVIVHRLEQVGCTVSGGCTELTVAPPTWRPDLVRPADLVEEVARLEGFDSIPSVLPAAPAGTGLTPAQRRERLVAADLASAGLTEVLSFPFIGTSPIWTRLGLPADDARRNVVPLANPLDADRPLMRTTLLPGLLDTVLRNMSRGTRDLLVFEIGSVFLPRRNAPTPPAVGVDRRPDPPTLAVLERGAAQPAARTWRAVLAGSAGTVPGWWGAGRPAGWADADRTGPPDLRHRRRPGQGGRRRAGAVAPGAVREHPGGRLADRLRRRAGAQGGRTPGSAPADRGSGAEPGRPAAAADPDGADDQRVPPGQPGRGARRARFGAGGGGGPDPADGRRRAAGVAPAVRRLQR